MRALEKEKANFPRALALLLLLGGTWSASLVSAEALTLPPGSLAASRAGNDLSLSFSTGSLDLYTVQTTPDLLRPWSNCQEGIPGDGTTKTVTVSNAFSGSSGFYRLLIQTPTKLVLPQASAFAVLGHSCGGIKEQVYVTGFDPTNGFPTGEVRLSTTCSTGGRGSRPATFTAWAAVTWDFAGNAISSSALSNAAAVDPTFVASDGRGEVIYNMSTAAYLVVPVPGAATGVTAVQSGDEFQVSWTPNGVNPAAITLSILTATPVGSPAPILTTTLSGPATTGVVPSLQPRTTYRITVVNTTVGGSGPSSTPIDVTTVPASIAPSAPTGIKANWTNPDPTGAADTLVANWQPAVPGDSPVDQYRVTITGSDGGGTFTQTVSGSTLMASFIVDYIPNWSVTVQAHNGLGWGPSSTAVTLGGL